MIVLKPNDKSAWNMYNLYSSFPTTSSQHKPLMGPFGFESGLLFDITLFVSSAEKKDVFRINTEVINSTKKVTLMIIRRITAIKLVSSAD